MDSILSTLDGIQTLLRTRKELVDSDLPVADPDQIMHERMTNVTLNGFDLAGTWTFLW